VAQNWWGCFERILRAGDGARALQRVLKDQRASRLAEVPRWRYLERKCVVGHGVCWSLGMIWIFRDENVA
jgi:hypothetical protein